MTHFIVQLCILYLYVESFISDKYNVYFYSFGLCIKK